MASALCVATCLYPYSQKDTKEFPTEKLNIYHLYVNLTAYTLPQHFEQTEVTSQLLMVSGLLTHMHDAHYIESAVLALHTSNSNT